jgi:general secretion pathway protein K
MSSGLTSRTSPGRQRGVALITAVLIVALATILAVSVGFKGYLDQRRSATTFALDQGFEVALGGEAWAADALRRDGMQSRQYDDFTEEWAAPIPPIPIDGGEFEGRLEDMQGRFNLNNLVLLGTDGQLRRNDVAVDRFKELLQLLKLEDKWATIIVDWLDSNGNEEFPDGAEDNTYTSQNPPYRAANMPITRTSELLSLPDFGVERYRRLEPFVTALPIGTPINTCTAPAEVLDALLGSGNQEYSQSRDNLAQTREQRCFPNEQELLSAVNDPLKQQLSDGRFVGQTSSYFRSTIFVTIGTTRLTLYSLLYRNNGTNLVRPILRSQGTL